MEAELYSQGYRIVEPGYVAGMDIICPNYANDWRKYMDDCDKLDNCAGIVIDKEENKTCLKSAVTNIIKNRNAELLIKMKKTELDNRININVPGYKNVLVNKAHNRDNIICMSNNLDLMSYADACNKNQYCQGFELAQAESGDYYACLKSAVTPYIDKYNTKIFVKDGVEIPSSSVFNPTGAPSGTTGAPSGTTSTAGAPSGTIGAPSGTIGAPSGTIGASTDTTSRNSIDTPTGKSSGLFSFGFSFVWIFIILIIVAVLYFLFSRSQKT